MMKCLMRVFGLIVTILLISSCSVDESNGISADGGRQLVVSVEDVPQAMETSRHPAGYIFYVDANGIILSSVPLSSMSRITAALLQDDASMLNCRGIVEIQERNVIENVFISVGGNDTSMSLSDVDIIGVITYDECIDECCGGERCSWGKLKYCINRCMEDHDPKQE